MSCSTIPLFIISFFFYYTTLTEVKIPIHLAEMSPPAYRATFPGVAYQLGNVRHHYYLIVFFFGFVVNRFF